MTLETRDKLRLTIFTSSGPKHLIPLPWDLNVELKI